MRKRLFIIAVTILWLFSTGLAFGAPVGKFTAVKGQVDLTAPDKSLHEVRIGDPVSVGDIVRTKSRSSVEITFADDSIVRLARNSRLKITKYMVSKEETHGILKLFRGKAQSIVSKAVGFFGFGQKNKFEMHTPTAVCGVRGTNFFTWYNQGTSGVAVKKGTVYNYAANKPNQVREVHAGQSSIVVSADEDPVVGEATDEELSLGDGEEGGEPSAFIGEPEADPFVPEETDDIVDDGETTKIIPQVADTYVPDFELALAGGFVDGTLTGDIGLGTLSLSGAYSSATAAAAMSVGGDLSNGGALQGSLGGVLGSWEGLFNSIYVNSGGGAGFIYGTLSGDVTGGSLSAEGPMTQTAALGQVADPAAELELETLYQPAMIIGTPDADPMVEGLLTANTATGADRWLGVFSLTASDTGYTPLAASAYYGLANSGTYSGVDADDNPVDIPYLMVGYANIVDDQTGHIRLADEGNFFYIDPLFHGTYDVNYRGAYDAEGNLSLAGSGSFVLDPLDYSGAWGVEAGTLYYNNGGYAGVAAEDSGLMGLVASATGYDFYAAGDYFLTGAASETDPFVWGTAIGGVDGTGSGDYLGGWTAGNWQYTTNSYGLPGGLDGAMAALKTSAAGGRVTVEQIYGDLIGEYFTAPLGYDESDGLFRVRDDGGLAVASMTAAEGDLELISGEFSQSLAGDLGASGAIQGHGGGYLNAFVDTSTGQGLGAFSVDLGYGGAGLASLSLGYGGNVYTGRGDGAQEIAAKAGGRIDYTAQSWAEIGASDAAGGQGYYLADVAGTLASDGSLTAGLAGTLMTQTFLADMNGSVFGQGADGEGAGDGTWIGQGVGILDNFAPLAFSGIVDYAEDWFLGPYYGLFSDNGGYLDTWGDVFALAGSTVSPWRYNGTNWVPQATDVLVMGETWGVDADGQYLWNDEIYSWNIFDTGIADFATGYGGGYTTYDGGSFNGFVGGVFSGGRINGRAVTLYMDPDGNAGVITGAADGEYFPDIAMMRAGGTWTPVQMATAADLGILPENLYDATFTDATMQAMATGNFAGAGYLNGYSVPFGGYGGYGYDSLSVSAPNSGYGGGWTRFIDGQDWGIYDFILSGYAEGYGGLAGGYENPAEATSWSAKVGGTAVFGSVAPEVLPGGVGASLAEFTLDEGYWLGSVTAGTWSGGTLEGDLNGIYLTPTHMGTLAGEAFGYYDDAGNWASTSLGTFDGEPLTYSAEWTQGVLTGENLYFNGPAYSYYDGLYSDSGNAVPDGAAKGLIGGVGDPLSGSADFLAMGEYENYGYGGQPHLWRNLITSDGGLPSLGDLGEAAVEPEENSLLALTVGQWLPGERADSFLGGFMTGALAGLYMSGDSVGVVTSYDPDLMDQYSTFQGFGDFYEFGADGYGGSYGMWMADGDLLLQDTLTIDENTVMSIDFLGIPLYGGGIPLPLPSVPDSGYGGAVLSGSFGDDAGSFAMAQGMGMKFSFSNYEGDDIGGIGIYAFDWGNFSGDTPVSLPMGNFFYDKPVGEDVDWTGSVAGMNIGINVLGYGGMTPSISYFVAGVDATWYAEDENGNGDIFGTFFGDFLSPTEWGTLSGPLFGLYSIEDTYGYGGEYAEGGWIANSTGTYEATPLALGGSWGYGGAPFLFSSIYDVYYDNVGEEWGLIGAKTSPFDGPTDLLAMGQYFYSGDSGDGLHLWNTPASGWIGTQTAESIYDGPGDDWGYTEGNGFYDAFTGGFWGDGETGRFAGLFAQKGETGYELALMTSDLTLSLYPQDDWYAYFGEEAGSLDAPFGSYGGYWKATGTLAQFGESWNVTEADTDTAGREHDVSIGEKIMGLDLIAFGEPNSEFVHFGSGKHSLPFGIFNLTLETGGFSIYSGDMSQFDNNLEEDDPIKVGGTNGEDVYWLADLRLDWEDVDFSAGSGYETGRITGNLSGVMLGKNMIVTAGNFDNPVYGLYEGDGYQGAGYYPGNFSLQSTGTFQGVRPTLSAAVAGYIDPYSMSGGSGWIEGRMASADTVDLSGGSATVDMLSIGMAEEGDSPWIAEVFGEGTFTYTDGDVPGYWFAQMGGSYGGLPAGDWGAETFYGGMNNGYFITLEGAGWVEADGGAVNGNAYEDIGYWETVDLSLAFGEEESFDWSGLFYSPNYDIQGIIGGSDFDIFGTNNFLNFGIIEDVNLYDMYQGTWYGQAGGAGTNAYGGGFYWLADSIGGGAGYGYGGVVGLDMEGVYLDHDVFANMHGSWYDRGYNGYAYYGEGSFYYGGAVDLEFASDIAGDTLRYENGDGLMASGGIDGIMGAYGGYSVDVETVMLGRFTDDREDWSHPVVATSDLAWDWYGYPGQGFLSGVFGGNGNFGLLTAMDYGEGAAYVYYGGFDGPVYPEINMWMAYGGMTGLEMPTELDDTEVAAEVTSTGLTGQAVYLDDPEDAFMSIEDGQLTAMTLARPGDASWSPGWHIFQLTVGGTYNDQETDWVMNIQNHQEAPTFLATLKIDDYSNYYPRAKGPAGLAGAWADLDQLTTGIAVGEIVGTFNPQFSTWQAVAQGMGIKTEEFLNMVASNQGVLQALGIPSFEVGRVDLSGTANGISVNMNDTIFFAHESASNPPSIWATNAIEGTNADDGNRLGTVGLSGGGVTANFNMVTYDTAAGAWGATVTEGAGTVGAHNVNFNGVAAGGISASDNTNFNGNGAGVVTSAATGGGG